MDIQEIIYSAIGIAVTGLVSFAVAKVTEFINSKISDSNAAKYLATIISLVGNCVQEIYQTYVEALKKEGKFDIEAQKIALDKCLNKIKSQMGPELIAYVTNNFGDVDTYLTSLIESTIYTLKK